MAISFVREALFKLTVAKKGENGFLLIIILPLNCREGFIDLCDTDLSA